MYIGLLLPESPAYSVSRQGSRHCMLDSPATAREASVPYALLACRKLTAGQHLYILATFHTGI